MQRSLAGMKGVPVITQQGVRIGTIVDGVLDLSEHRLVAFEIDWEDDQGLERTECLPLQSLSELNADVATIAGELGISQSMAWVDTEAMPHPLREMLGLPIRWPDGTPIGILVDLLFDPRDGGVYAYEYLPGQALDAPQDARFLRPHRTIRFVPGQMLLLEEASGGVFRTEPVPRVDIRVMTQLGLEEPQGEEDIELQRHTSGSEA
ncbi:MAG: PRC-barrel domain-containing protein [Candidatus Sericytochromatia bacterium]|nr:PRC-barrel domain-containing protein [Candidatus Sericytochromatia bacterium]